ncbi:hypothetical protein LDENG_00043930 [Lucifuga dentata]|nr:hypothetical protein LDENG_00043930 [Lucifuga dentata]
MGDKTEDSRPKRVFVNDVDTYSSKYIAEFLSTCTNGEHSEESDDTVTNQHEPAFHIVGTVSSSSKNRKTSFLLEQYKSPTQDQLLCCLLECDVVLYNISENATQQLIDEATWAITALHAEMESFTAKKMFILVSTVMTWARTKPKDVEESDVTLAEEDYRRRRPHPSFKNHNELEKLVLKLCRPKKSKLTGHVIAAGLQYGKVESLFHCFFKMSWSAQFQKVSLFGEGMNYIPMIHVDDLAGVIHNIINLKPKSKYIVAVDDSKNTLEDIVKMISDVLGSGKIDNISEQEAIDMKILKPEELEYLSINLRLEPYLKNNLNIQWVSEAGMIENMDRIVEEYKNTRQLLPIRICITGPPAVGKTTVAEKLCSYYQIHHITLKAVIEEKISQLEMISGSDSSESVSEEEIAASQKQLETIQENMEMNEGRLADDLVADIMQQKLYSAPCRNQGFILDGFPETYEQAKLIFFDGDTEDQDSRSKTPTYNEKITPEHVFAFNASDDFLIKRAQALPQSAAEKMNYTAEDFVARLERYRQLMASEETLLDYFDQLEILPEHIEVNTDDPEYTDVMKKITEMVGTPNNYGLSPEEQEEEDRRLEEERQQKVVMEAAERKCKKEAVLAAMTAEYEEWMKNLSEVKKQESELQEARCLPLRNYLMKHVMPSLTEAMLDCCKFKPDDPVDFLAEHLLQNNHKD